MLLAQVLFHLTAAWQIGLHTLVTVSVLISAIALMIYPLARLYLVNLERRSEL